MCYKFSYKKTTTHTHTHTKGYFSVDGHPLSIYFFTMSTYNALVTKLVIIFTLSPVSGILSLIQQRLQCCLSLCSLYLALETQELVKYEDASAVFVCGFELINYSSLQQQRKLQQNTITFVSICACHGSYCLM